MQRTSRTKWDKCVTIVGEKLLTYYQANNKEVFIHRPQQLELRFVLQMEWCITHHTRAQYIETTLQCTEMK